MDYSEKWGKDVDEAVRLALADLGLNEDEVVVTVLEQPTKGFFGIGANLAKVRVEKVTDKNSAKIEEKKHNEKKHKDEKKATAGPHNTRDLRKKDKNKDRQAAPNKTERAEGRTVQANKKEDREEKRFENKKLKDIQISERPTDLKEDPESAAAVFLSQILKDMKSDVQIESFKNDDCYYIEIKGNDSKQVIGKRGQTLDAIQYLANLVVNKDLDDYMRVIIDVEGYRSRRERTLENLADKLARKVQKTGKNVRLEPMNPYERKVIHATLQGYEGIETRSEGEEPYRRIVIERKY